MVSGFADEECRGSKKIRGKQKSSSLETQATRCGYYKRGVVFHSVSLGNHSTPDLTPLSSKYSSGNIK
jgi:hypothetical protein